MGLSASGGRQNRAIRPIGFDNRQFQEQLMEHQPSTQTPLSSASG